MIRVNRFQHELCVVLEAARVASKAAKLVSSSFSQVDKELKNDQSPVTVADFACQILISYHLKKHFPNDLLVGEEEPSLLVTNSILRERVLRIVRQVSSTDTNLSDDEWLSLLHCTPAFASSSSGDECIQYDRYWTIDPIDGTKGFLRQAQYAVCIALLVENEVQVGALACPNLPFPSMLADQTSGGSLLFAAKGEGAFQIPLDSLFDSSPQQVTVASPEPPFILLESFEASHSNTSLSQPLLTHNFAKSMKYDSQCKYAMLARGEGHLFLRIIPNPRAYIEKIWDHAAGKLIVEEAGGIVTDVRGLPLVFHPKKHLTQNLGILATCGPLSFHHSIIEKLNASIEFQAYLEKNG